MLKQLFMLICLVAILQLLCVCYCHSQWARLNTGTEGPYDFVSASNEKPKESPRIQPDGSFNGFDLFYVNHRPKSSVHCVGENFNGDRSWLYRSCEFKTLCYDLDHRDFVYFRESNVPMPNELWWSSTQLRPNRTLVAGGSQPRTWFPIVTEDVWNMTTRIGMYRPAVFVGKSAPKGYYRFDATMLPFYRHPTSHRNPGHLLWDDFLALYTLLDIFDREGDPLYLAHLIRPSTEEFVEDMPSFDLINKFLPLMGNHQYNVTVDDGIDVTFKGQPLFKPGDDRIICADHALTGSGLFADHASHRWHGQTRKDREGQPNNLGRGGLFRRYRRFLMKNIGLLPDNQIQRKPKYQIIFSQNSSTKGTRANVSFVDHIDALSVLANRTELRPLNIAKMGLVEQIEITSKAAFFVTMVGGGTATAMFLPKGAHLILFYRPNQYLDWDFWNNFPHVKVHWLPLWRDQNRTNNGGLSLDSFVALIEAELDMLDHADET